MNNLTRRLLFAIVVLLGVMIAPPTWADLNDGLVAYYPFNGNANDESGNGHHGTVNGATLTEDKFGESNQAYNFPELNDYIEIGDVDALDGIPQLTGTAWINPSSVDMHNAALISKWDTCGQYHAGFLMILINRELSFIITDSSDRRLVVKTTLPTVSSDIWQHVAFVFDGLQSDVADRMKIYYNGMKQPTSVISSYPHTQTSLTSSSLLIATKRDSVCAHENFNGKMDDIRIYNRALSEDEIQALYDVSDNGTCQLYAVHDEGLNDSQLLTINPDTLAVAPLGEIYQAYDIEALDAHPDTDALYAASGDDTNNPGHLYTVNSQTGALTDIGSTGFNEIESLSFHPNGILWAWARVLTGSCFDSELFMRL